MIEFQAIIDAQNLMHDGATFEEAVNHPDMDQFCILDDELADFEDLVLDTGRLDMDDFNN